MLFRDALCSVSVVNNRNILYGSMEEVCVCVSLAQKKRKGRGLSNFVFLLSLLVQNLVTTSRSKYKKAALCSLPLFSHSSSLSSASNKNTTTVILFTTIIIRTQSTTSSPPSPFSVHKRASSSLSSLFVFFLVFLSLLSITLLSCLPLVLFLFPHITIHLPPNSCSHSFIRFPALLPLYLL